MSVRPVSTDTAPGAPLLDVRDLSVSFTQYARGLRRRHLTPVRGMTLQARAGEVTALVGASGSGKTLLGLAVLGLLPTNASTSGEIRYDGAPLSDARRAALVGGEVAMLPQSMSHLDPTATVRAQVARALELGGRPAADAEAVLAARGLGPEVLARYPHELSGGMARRVLLAMVLSSPRRLLVADEPTPGLDPDSARRTLAEIRGLADAGAAVVLISHDLVGVLDIADRIVVTDHGTTLETALPAQFAGDGAGLVHPYSRALWRAMPANGFHLPGEEALVRRALAEPVGGAAAVA
ncbi:ATP-binding cassette domain-containing protein [Nocardioides sp. dk4132]|uniref:ATP-binding cassette domain-containing protein n=1 Tax=unclassified Nocardioides TaxID=2615069 RepID=UPI0012960E5C|nr:MULTISPECIES: ATP-binding cassette domain-containing protein [unclassified Nocardioides]MQW77696.1 ATP-binding cassette domain-containing protein [Nocardioides sp. dk4132]QGA07111.1 ATP-binding cassette domain-containing protein [Nocardioides sp. dk884]